MRCQASCASSTVAPAARHFVSSARLPMALLASADRRRSASNSVADLFAAATGASSLTRFSTLAMSFSIRS
jgi:hypothetical protein